LLVDDNKDFLESLVELLSLGGFSTVVAYDNAQDALSYLKENRVDIILSDLIMPKMNGKQFHDAVQKLTLPPCFILITGSDINDVCVEQCMNIPTLHKPFGLTQLMRFMQSTLEERALEIDANYSESALAVAS